MPVKFNQYWSVVPEREEDYRKFIINKFIAQINKLGIHTVAGWYVIVGSYAEIILEGVSNDLDQLEKALVNPKFKELKDQLLNYVMDYKSKVLVPTGRRNSYSMDIETNTIKFSQSWDIRLDKVGQYERFVSEKFYPAMEQLDISIANEWEVFIGDGPGIICEGRIKNVNSLLSNLQSKVFDDAKSELHKYIKNYSSRFLSFHIQKMKGYKAESYILRP